MNNFEKMLLFLKSEPLNEMAVLSPDQHNFDVDVKIHILKEHEEQKLRHSPRIKVYKKFNEQNFTISITDEPKVIGRYKDVVSTKELNHLIECVVKFKMPLLNYFYDVTYQKYDMIIDIQSIEEGDEVEKRY